MLTRILDYEISIRRLVALAIILGIPYGVIGVIWAFNHTEHLESLTGIDKVFSFIGEVIAWPPLVISDITLR